MDKKRVLFLCTENSCRSQMAEGFLRDIAGDRFEVSSAGLNPKPINLLAIQVMKEAGVDISSQQPTDVKEFLGKGAFDYVVAVCEQTHQQCPKIFPGIGERMLWPFEDPAKFDGSDEEKLDKFREIRDQIKARLESWVAETEKASQA